MARVIVTGGAGYLGSMVVPMLLASGHEVTIFDLFTFGAQPVASFVNEPGLSLIRGDIRDRDAIRDAMEGQDVIVHLAAIVGYPACIADPIRATTTNVGGTRNIVEAMKEGQRLVFASTGSTYGRVTGVASEETPIAPLSLYGRNKRDGEEAIQEAGVDHVILRFATVFGVSPRTRLDLMVNDFVYIAIHSKQLVLYEGDYRRTFLHCRDAARAVALSVERFDDMKNETFNVGDASMNYTKKDVAEAVQKIIPFYLHEADTGHDIDQRDYHVDYTKINKVGFNASVSLEDGIAELAKFFSVLVIHNPWRNS